MNPINVDLAARYQPLFGAGLFDWSVFSLRGSDFASAAWAQFWQVTLVAIVVGTIARWGCRRRPHLAYLLWMLVIAKALTPPFLASPAGVFSWALHTVSPPPVVAAAPRTPPRESRVRTPVPRPIEFDDANESPSRPPESASSWARLTSLHWAVLVWALGAVTLGSYAIAKWIAFRRRWQAAAVSAPAGLSVHVAELAKRLGLRPGARKRLQLLVSRAADAPAVFGVWRPTILLPAGLLAHFKSEHALGSEPTADAHLEAILAHELIHVRRRDPAAALVQLGAQLLWWFHPLVWMANREIRRERERACDEEVVAGLGCRPRDYARALLEVLEAQTRSQPAFAVPGVGMLGVTARRLEHIVRGGTSFHKQTPRWNYLVAVVALALVLPGAGLQLAAAPPEKSANAGSGAEADADGKKSQDNGPTIIVTKNVMLWDNKIVTWDEVLKRFRAMRTDGPFQPHFKFTNGAIGAGRFESTKKDLYEVYKELFEPAGMSLGVLSPRGGDRLDKIRTAADLVPDPALARSGLILAPDGKPASGAQVVVLPKKSDAIGVILAGKQIRDRFDQDWIPTDNSGKYTIHPQGDCLLTVLHEAGWYFGPAPVKGDNAPLKLQPWANVVFSTTGETADQTASIRVRPAEQGDEEWNFIMYEIRTAGKPVTVPVPGGKVTVDRTLKVDNRYHSMPAEQFTIAAGEKHDAALGPPTAEDRAKAEKMSADLRRLIGGAQKDKEAKPADGSGVDGAQAITEEFTIANETTLAGGSDVGNLEFTGTTELTGNFLEFAAEPEDGTGIYMGEDVEMPEQLQVVEMPDTPAIKRLIELGADIYASKTKKGQLRLTVMIVREWKGTAQDVALLNDVPDLWVLQVDFAKIDPQAFGRLKPRPRIEALILDPLDDEALAKIDSLPACKQLVIDQAALTGAGCQRLAKLISGVESLQLQGMRDRRQPEQPPKFQTDEGCKYLGQAASLQTLLITDSAFTDAGIADLAGLNHLKRLSIVNCPGVTGTGFAKLTSLAALKSLSLISLDLTGAGLQAIGQLTQVKSLMLVPEKARAEDLAGLAKLVNLKSLVVSLNGRTDETEKTIDAGDAILAAAEKMPDLRLLSLSNIGASNSGVAALESLEHLQGVTIDGLAADDQSLARLGKLKELRRIMLSGPSKITDQGMASLAGLDKLRVLNLNAPELTDAGLRPLGSLAALNNLTLMNSKITGKGFAALAPLEKLTALSLNDSAIDDQGCRALAGLSALTYLNLNRAKITDAAIPEIAKMSNLGALDVSHTKVTVAGLEGLRTMKKLKRLAAIGEGITKPGLTELRKKLPGVDVIDHDGQMWVYSLQLQPMPVEEEESE